MKLADLEAPWGPAAVGHCSTLLKLARLEIAFFIVKRPSALHQAVILPHATLPGSWVLSCTGKKKISKKRSIVEGFDCLPGILLSTLERSLQKS